MLRLQPALLPLGAKRQLETPFARTAQEICQVSHMISLKPLLPFFILLSGTHAFPFNIRGQSI